MAPLPSYWPLSSAVAAMLAAQRRELDHYHSLPDMLVTLGICAESTFG